MDTFSSFSPPFFFISNMITTILTTNIIVAEDLTFTQITILNISVVCTSYSTYYVHVVLLDAFWTRPHRMWLMILINTEFFKIEDFKKIFYQKLIFRNIYLK